MADFRKAIYGDAIRLNDKEHQEEVHRLLLTLKDSNSSTAQSLARQLLGDDRINGIRKPTEESTNHVENTKYNQSVHDNNDLSKETKTAVKSDEKFAHMSKTNIHHVKDSVRKENIESSQTQNEQIMHSTNTDHTEIDIKNDVIHKYNGGVLSQENGDMGDGVKTDKKNDVIEKDTLTDNSVYKDDSEPVTKDEDNRYSYDKTLDTENVDAGDDVKTANGLKHIDTIGNKASTIQTEPEETETKSEESTNYDYRDVGTDEKNKKDNTNALDYEDQVIHKDYADTETKNEENRNFDYGDKHLDDDGNAEKDVKHLDGTDGEKLPNRDVGTDQKSEKDDTNALDYEDQTIHKDYADTETKNEENRNFDYGDKHLDDDGNAEKDVKHLDGTDGEELPNRDVGTDQKSEKDDTNALDYEDQTIHKDYADTETKNEENRNFDYGDKHLDDDGNAEKDVKHLDGTDGEELPNRDVGTDEKSEKDDTNALDYEDQTIHKDYADTETKNEENRNFDYGDKHLEKNMDDDGNAEKEHLDGTDGEELHKGTVDTETKNEENRNFDYGDKHLEKNMDDYGNAEKEVKHLDGTDGEELPKGSKTHPDPISTNNVDVKNDQIETETHIDELQIDDAMIVGTDTGNEKGNNTLLNVTATYTSSNRNNNTAQDEYSKLPKNVNIAAKDTGELAATTGLRIIPTAGRTTTSLSTNIDHGHLKDTKTTMRRDDLNDSKNNIRIETKVKAVTDAQSPGKTTITELSQQSTTTPLEQSNVSNSDTKKNIGKDRLSFNKQTTTHILYGTKKKHGSTPDPTVRPAEETTNRRPLCAIAKGSGYNNTELVAASVGGVIVGGVAVFALVYFKKRCSRYYNGDYQRVPREYDFELNPRLKTHKF